MIRIGHYLAALAVVAFSLTSAPAGPALFSVRRGLPLSWVSIR